MTRFSDNPFVAGHDHVFLGAGHEQNERKTWAVIAICSLMMLAEIIGGSLFGSLALVADGLHMATHAGAMLVAALAYTYARKHASDPRFVFGTGKLGDLAGFTSAIILAMIALLIGYEAVARCLAPVRIHFGEAIPIAVVGLLVNIVSAWLLSGEDHHGHDHGHGHGRHGEADYNMRAAYIHVMADAAVSVLAIIGLLLARTFGWLWMDPLAGIVGALVIANWSYGLVRATGAILVDISPDDRIAGKVRAAVEVAGDQLVDLHVWRLGPGHFGAVVSVVTQDDQRRPAFYHEVLRPLTAISHLTVEVNPQQGGSWIGNLRAIGMIRSQLSNRESAPNQGNEGAPDAWLEMDAVFREGLEHVSVGNELILITWFHMARRDILKLHPRRDLKAPLKGVFSTRSPDRPNPLGLHKVLVLELDGNRIRVGPLEAIDGTPVVDIKPVLPNVVDS